MKKILSFIIISVLISCAPTKIDETVTFENRPAVKIDNREAILDHHASNNTTATQAGNDVSLQRDKIDFSSAGQIQNHMEFLASDKLQGRDTGSEGLEKAAEYIEYNFQKNNIAPYFSSYKDTLSNFDKPAYNVVGVVEGNDPVLKKEFIIVGAHYDHIGIIQAVNGDSIANGANDNASGTSIVLELARYFGRSKTNKRSIIFALFSGEEKGLLGSRHLAGRLKAQSVNLYTMLNFEMVGVPLVDKDYLMYLTGYEKSDLADISNKYAGEKLVGFLPTAKEFNLFQRSDNYPFHQDFNVPSQTFSTFDFTNFDFYHKVGDENSLMDFAHMANLVNRTIPVIEGIANAPTDEIKYK
ncbi:M28 family peptidase [Flavobacteriaceae bacterium F89]|uniref:M28 family peptidase n=1 Tax=Cerina litoralis TaxID=2874477 RepID=A0AAE3EWS0_9FLAO|nr:M28 family peptidase [Cerina litoralis]MCG2461703.1 M28 family peptidase [Cerina litoralis]